MVLVHLDQFPNKEGTDKAHQLPEFATTFCNLIRLRKVTKLLLKPKGVSHQYNNHRGLELF